MLKGLYYCQYLVGIGHLMRSLRISHKLVNQFQIDFLSGGYPVSVPVPSHNFLWRQLSPLGIVDPLNDQLEDDPQRLQEAFSRRRKEIAALDTPYDFLITEIFPFRRWRLFKEEGEFLIQHLKTLNPQMRVICSARDSFSEADLQRDQEILSFLKRYYDLILVHSDPRVFRAEESFTFAKEISDKIVYTGFITQDTNPSTVSRLPQIVVSNGTGSFGTELMHAVAEVVHFFPSYKFLFIIGPKAPLDLPKTLQALFKGTNAEVLPFVEDFPDLLQRSALSISLCGCNTIMDIVQSRIPALVLPYLYKEQYIRALKFEGLGLIHLLTTEDLNPEKLSQAISRAISAPVPALDIAMSGAETTTRAIKDLLK